MPLVGRMGSSTLHVYQNPDTKELHRNALHRVEVRLPKYYSTLILFGNSQLLLKYLLSLQN